MEYMAAARVKVLTFFTPGDTYVGLSCTYHTERSASSVCEAEKHGLKNTRFAYAIA